MKAGMVESVFEGLFTAWLIEAVHEKMKTKIAKGYNLKLQIKRKKQRKNYTQCGKFFSKVFNLKLQNKMFMK